MVAASASGGVYAYVPAGVVQGIFTPPGALTMGQCWPADMLPFFLDVTTVSPRPSTGWTYSNGVFSQPAGPVVQPAALVPTDINIVGTNLVKTLSDASTVAQPLPSIPPITRVLSTAGVSALGTIFRAVAVTDSNGAFSFDYTAAGFTAPPQIKVQAIASATGAANAVLASPMTPTATSVSGFVVKPVTTTLGATLAALLGLTISPLANGGAGITVQLTATGT